MNEHNQIKEFLAGWRLCEDEKIPEPGCSEAFLWGWKERFQKELEKSEND